MILEVLRWVGYATIVYFILMQTYLVFLAVTSGMALRRNHHLRRFGRVGEMLSSKSSPPVSIIIPAYNEEAGIVDAVRSMSIVKYPRFELVVVNDGSKDRTLESLIEAFSMEKVQVPIRKTLQSAPVRGVYRGRSGVDLTLIDKENAGRADALNAGINAARYPYVFLTDADVILAPDCLVQAMQRVVEDRERTVGIGGNIRPLNGSKVQLGHLIEASVPRKIVPRFQVLEYVRTFLATRPAWSWMNAVPLVSGAFGIWRRDAIMAVGGLAEGHMGEDMDLTMRIHKHYLQAKIPYRIVYEPSAVVWTEVPETLRVLRRQRIRWHRGLLTIVRDFKGMTFNPRYRQLGMITWSAFYLFEYLAPMIEFVGWFVIPVAWYLGVINQIALIWMLLIALAMGILNSLIALLLDESYGYFNSPKDTSRLIVMSLIENFGIRQMTVLWRIRALFGGRAVKSWGNMERKGVANLAKQT